MNPEDANLIGFLLSALVGAVLGGGGVLVVGLRVVGKIKNDTPTLDYMEKLYNAIPLVGVKDLLKDVADILNRVTDGKPNDTPVG